MHRDIINDLQNWKSSKRRKPLVLQGARQVGKTWLMKEFGQTEFESFVYFSFDSDNDIKQVFKNSKNPKTIVTTLSIIAGKPIEPNKTLIIFDEIQECPDALNSLKYFCEEAPEYFVICAGSLLGTLLAQPKSYPVGKVDLLKVAPLNFAEFIRAVDKNLWEYYSSIRTTEKLIDAMLTRLTMLYRTYLIIGGMPEAVQIWIDEQDASAVLTAQKNILKIYENDFSKYHGKVNNAKILFVFKNIVSQLAKDNHKFIYGALKPGARAREYENAIEWLVSAGFVNRVYNCSKLEHPLPAFDNLTSFKLYMFDTGLLKCAAAVSNQAIMTRSNYQFAGALAENYVLQQIANQFDIEPRYFNNAQSEIDFVIQNGMDIIPIEVKAGLSKHSRSFKNLCIKQNVDKAFLFSERNFTNDGKFTNIPLCMAPKLKNLV